ncbi:DNA-deoxyinosine glycosylase [Methylobacillus caricis]|uniref:DNA-deoxyinosine glycosylase n=1 Tax=Methylobacillus caricis TaxID=1971611 RepID=UPI001CFFEF4A|nr:DNA-deoxyinosine glycosylase [Methylobacillus caricis]MCB5188784.1 DNA-deoxyinosine glycosylase [Methylobacillus caricis]
MALVQSFAPAADANCRVLILGSMPGRLSLAQQQYYAHPQNLFWPFMGELFGALPTMPYQQRLAQLHTHGIAVWDVLQECFRSSSLDGDIEEATIIANDFNLFFAAYPNIRHVFFNGSKAEQAYQRYVARNQFIPVLHYQKLPSTSPANASIPRVIKLAQWQAVRRAVESQ